MITIRDLREQLLTLSQKQQYLKIRWKVKAIAYVLHDVL